MASIRQQIPFYIHGISEQPDELKKPGQVRDAKNAIPDVITGLSKRPGARLINPLGFNDDGSGYGTSKSGSWFSIYRDEKEKYIGHINKSGAVEIWDTNDGMPAMIYYSDVPIPVKYPNKPENPDNLGRPANTQCLSDEFIANQNVVKTKTKKVKKKQEKIDKLYTKLEDGDYGTSTPNEDFIEYNKLGGNRYEVTVGYVEGDDYLPNNKSATFSRGMPEGAIRGPIIISNAKYVWPADKYWENMVETAIKNADIYAWRIPGDAATDEAKEELEEEIRVQEEELKELQEELDEATTVYRETAYDCGLHAEDSQGRFQTRELSEDRLPGYLFHQSTGDIQTLTVNDYTFVNNRNMPVSMSKAEVNERPYEAFVELKQIAYGKQYGIDIWSPSNDIQVETSKASSLTLAESTWEKKGNDGCAGTGSQIFDVNEDEKKNLRFEITTTGQSILRNPSDPGDGYKCVYQSQVNLLHGGENWKKGDKVTVTMNDFEYKVIVNKAYVTTAMYNAPVRPTPTSSEGDEVVTAESILTSLAAAIEENDENYTTEIIGNGIYITAPWQILVSTPEAQLLNVVTDRCNNIAKLPTQCKDGYQVVVENSSADEDDYYVQFKTKYNGVSGEGAWEEIANPGVETSFNWSSMPYQIVRQADGTFIVSPIDWDLREAGDNITNPVPSFVGKTINKMLFFRNRLCMLSDENIVLSRPGDFFNFFGTTALKVIASDPIDVSVASTYPSILFDGIEVNAGLMLFSANQQFLLTTDNDSLTPETVKVNGIASYRYNTLTKPISMGPTVGFVNDAGSRSRFFEMMNIKREGEVEVIEQSKAISKSMPSALNLLAESRENSIVFLGKSDEQEVWIYKYFQDGQKRIQSAWVRWELTGRLVFHAVLGDTYFVVVANEFENADSNGLEVLTLQRIDLKDNTWSAIVEDDSGYEYSVHMDNYKVVWPSDTQYYVHLDKTYFKLPMGYFSDKQLAAYTLKYGKLQGRAIYPKIEIDTLGTWCVLDGNWDTTRLMLGYEFEMSVEFPTIYSQKTTPTGVVSDTTASLVVHRATLNLGPSGVYETTLKRPNRSDYTMLYETRLEDSYDADAVAFVPEIEQKVPIYERNTNVTLVLKSSHPSPATLYSMTWEGDYNPRYYKSA